MFISKKTSIKAGFVCIFGIIVLNLFAFQSTNNNRPAYLIYAADGTVINYEELIKKVSINDICLFGELHDNPIAHWLELQIIRDLDNKKKGNITVGAEMWEMDNQELLDELQVSKIIDFQTYVENSRLWPNSSTDYLPILEYAVNKNIKFIATNVPRRYASIVADKGMASLNTLLPKAKSYMAPFPIKVDFNNKLYLYIAESFKLMTQMPMRKKDVSSLVEAQILKDATMAYSISRNLKPNSIFFHFHGELHSAFYSGIMYYLHEYCPNKKIVTISMMEIENPETFKPNNNRADFYIIVPKDMTKTYME